MMHGMTNDKGSSLGHTSAIIWVVVNFVRDLIDEPAHEVDVGGGMPEFRCHELGWIRSDTSQEMFDQPPRLLRTSRRSLRSPQTRNRGDRDRSWADRLRNSSATAARRIREFHSGNPPSRQPARIHSGPPPRSRQPRYRRADTRPHIRPSRAPDRRGYYPSRRASPPSSASLLPPARAFVAAGGRAAQTP